MLWTNANAVCELPQRQALCPVVEYRRVALIPATSLNQDEGARGPSPLGTGWESSRLPNHPEGEYSQRA
jgi:hypothetical protein